MTKIYLQEYASIICCRQILGIKRDLIRIINRDNQLIRVTRPIFLPMRQAKGHNNGLAGFINLIGIESPGLTAPMQQLKWLSE